MKLDTSDEPTIQWSAEVRLEVVKEVVRLAELQMEDIAALYFAAHERATSLAATQATISTALLVAAITLISLKNVPVIAFAASMTAALMFAIGASAAILASHPKRFFARGFNPALFSQQHPSSLQIAKATAQDLAIRIETNRAAQIRTAKLTIASQWIGLSAVIAAPLSAFVTNIMYG